MSSSVRSGTIASATEPGAATARAEAVEAPLVASIPYVDGRPSVGAGMVTCARPASSVFTRTSASCVVPQLVDASLASGAITCGTRTTCTRTSRPAAISPPASLAAMVTGTAVSGAQVGLHAVATDSTTSPLPSMWIDAPPLAPVSAASTAASPAGESPGSASSAPNAPAASSLASVDASVRPRETTDRCTSPLAGR